MSPWFYHNEILESLDQFPKEAIGFVYRITRVLDGKTYIGKKLIYFKKTAMKTVVLKNGTKKKKKVSTQVESDWKTYWSSSVELQKDVEQLGESAFRREILMFCPNKGSLGYYEARQQMDERLLEKGELSYNGIINCRVHWSHIKPPL